MKNDSGILVGTFTVLKREREQLALDNLTKKRIGIKERER